MNIQENCSVAHSTKQIKQMALCVLMLAKYTGTPFLEQSVLVYICSIYFWSKSNKGQELKVRPSPFSTTVAFVFILDPIKSNSFVFILFMVNVDV